VQRLVDVMRFAVITFQASIGFNGPAVYDGRAQRAHFRSLLGSGSSGSTFLVRVPLKDWLVKTIVGLLRLSVMHHGGAHGDQADGPGDRFGVSGRR
jgi:hypothetical protein